MSRDFAERVAAESFRLAISDFDPEARAPIVLRSLEASVAATERLQRQIDLQLMKDARTRRIADARALVLRWRSDPDAWRSSCEVLSPEQIADVVRTARESV
jgi:hypothetical protein